MKKNIVVIADDESRDFYSLLRFRERKVEIVNLKESLLLIRNSTAEIILLDCGSDPIKGLNILIEIKNHAYDVPIIFLTDVRSYETAVQAYKIGVRDYLKKPISLTEIRRIIEDLLTVRIKTIEKRRPLPCFNKNMHCQMLIDWSWEVPVNIYRLIRDIEDDPSRMNNLDDIAKKANLSKYHFSRTFKDLTGFSPMEYVRIMKMHKAKKLFQRTDLPISVVAEEVGYDDLRNFERQFKQHTGITPSMYKRFLNSQ